MVGRLRAGATLLGCWHILLVGLLILEDNGKLAAAEASPRKFLGTNWKCSLETVSEVDELVRDLNRMWDSLSSSDKRAVELCVNPPYVFCDRVRSRLHRDMSVGSQNMLDATHCGSGGGKNTGSVTADMLRAVGCDWVLLGQSDRRNNLGETDKLIAAKIRTALAAGLGVTLTIGELRSQRRWGRTLATLRRQLGVACAAIRPDEWNRIVVAYEPVWAVGVGATPCSTTEAQRVHAALRVYVTRRAGADAAAACRLVYTGSVTDANAAAYATQPDVDGFVVGRAGFNTTKLRSILQTLAQNGGDL